MGYDYRFCAQNQTNSNINKKRKIIKVRYTRPQQSEGEK